MGSAALDVATVAALVEVAHRAGLKVIAHATTSTALINAVEAKVDILTHAPFDTDVDEHLTRALATRGETQPRILLQHAPFVVFGSVGVKVR